MKWHCIRRFELNKGQNLGCTAKYLIRQRRSKDQSDYKLFVYHRNQVKYKKEKAQSQYYVHVNENQNRPKKPWQILKEIGASSKGKTTPKSFSLNIENELCFDKPKVAEYFNDYVLLLLLHHLSRSFHHVQADLGMLMLLIFYQNQNVSDNMFGLVSVTVDQISSILNSISASKVTGLDELPARLKSKLIYNYWKYP